MILPALIDARRNNGHELPNATWHAYCTGDIRQTGTTTKYEFRAGVLDAIIVFNNGDGDGFVHATGEVQQSGLGGRRTVWTPIGEPIRVEDLPKINDTLSFDQLGLLLNPVPA